MMLSQFRMLTANQQMKIIWSEGTFIADRKLKRYSIPLYQLFSFYVEVWYENLKSEIDIIYAFDNTDYLDPYLYQINISPLKDVI